MVIVSVPVLVVCSLLVMLLVAEFARVASDQVRPLSPRGEVGQRRATLLRLAGATVVLATMVVAVALVVPLLWSLLT